MKFYTSLKVTWLPHYNERHTNSSKCVSLKKRSAEVFEASRVVFSRREGCIPKWISLN